jgi:WD40 repeat protein
MLDFTGKVIKSYELRELIDAGGFAVVYRANQAVIEREVAIKIIYPHFASRPNFIRRFEAEAQLVAELEHPYIVPLYDYWRDPQGAYIVMRWLRGGALRGALKGEPWEIEAIARTLAQVTAALSFAHLYGVVHRDLKPENILLDEAGNAYLADFGIARILSEASDDMSAMGSPAYAAPEQIASQPTTPRTDQYSLGIILYELLTGQHPFPDLADLTFTELTAKRVSEPLPPLSRARPDLPPALDQVIRRATALHPEERFPDIQEMLIAFQQAIVPLLRRSGAYGTKMTAEIAALQLEERRFTNLPNPYKGLRTFQESDAANFFGRRALIERLLKFMGDHHPLARFLAVIGPSGSGKSSVVKAGLIPALRGGALPGSRRWFYVEMTPGTQPFKELEVALTSIAVSPPTDLYARLTQSKEGLLEALNELLPDDGVTELCLFIDQFEEVFTMVEDEAAIGRFLESLHHAVTQPNSRLRLIITLRADFFDRPLLRPIMSELMRERAQVVTPLEPHELEEALVEPARRQGVLIEYELVSAIIAEVSSQPGTLPLVQYLMSQLFERRDGMVIRMDAYKQMGGVRGALARRADELYSSFTPEQQQAMEQLFLRLITLGDGVEDTRRRALLTEVTTLGDRDTMRAVIDAVGKARLIAFDRDPETRAPTVEVTHEAIIREWARLRAWLDASRNDVRLQRNLAAFARDWENSGRDPSFLLRDKRLRQFENWITETTVALTDIERAFLDASLEEQAKRQTIELQRAEKERKLEQRARDRLRILVVVMSLALVIGSVLLVLALDSSRRAQEESILSRSLAQSASARQFLSLGEGDLAVALALASTSIDNPRPEAWRTLLEVALAPGTRAVLRGHASAVSTVAFNPDGSLLASGSPDSTVRVWRTASGELLHVLTGHRGDVNSIAFSPTDNRMVSVSNDFLAIVWDAAAGVELHRLSGHTQTVIAAAFSPDGRSIVTGARDALLILWDADTGAEQRRFTGSTASVTALDFSPDGARIVSGAGDGGVIVWDVSTGAALLTIDAHDTAITDIAFSPDGARILSASSDSTFALFDAASGAEIRRYQVPPDAVLSFDYDPSGEAIYAALRSGNVQRYDLNTGRETFALRGHVGDVFTIALASGGQIIASGGADTTIRLWSIGLPARVGAFSGHARRITGMSFAPAGDPRLYTSGLDGRLRVWDSSTYRELAQIDAGEPIRASALDWSADRAFIGLANGSVRVYTLSTGALQGEYPIHTTAVVSMAVSLSGNRVISSGSDGLRLWDADTGEVLNRFDDYRDTVLQAAFSPDGSLLAFGALNNAVIVWEVNANRERLRLTGHQDSVWSVAFSQDGRRLLSGSRDRSAVVWDAASGAQIGRFAGHAGAVRAVALASATNTALSAADTGEIIWWDIGTGEELQRFQASGAPVFKLAFDPNDPTTFVSGTEGGFVERWRTLALSELTAWTRANRFIPELTCQERLRYQVEPYCEGGA